MDHYIGNHKYLPLRRGMRCLYRSDGSLPPKDAPDHVLFLTDKTANSYMATTGDIRILELLPGSFADPLQCRLRVAAIENNPAYDALSYMWGDPSLPKTSIYLDDEIFPVTQSLENALRHMRLQDSIRYLWADAVCINQRDKKERGNQVYLMKYIYSGADTVRVWIDVELSPKDAVVQKLFTLEVQGPVNQLGDDPEFWKTLLPLLQNEYWDRLWIQQELVFAPKLVFYCRGVAIPGDCLMAFQHQISRKLTGRGPFDTDNSWSFFRPLESTVKAPSRNLAYWRAMMDSKVPVDPLTLEPNLTLSMPKTVWQLDPKKWGSHLSTSPIYLFGMLRQSQALKLTDPRDRVRAVLNLVIDYQDAGEEVGYEEDLAKAYLRPTRLLPWKCNGLQFLAMAKTCTSPDAEIKGLPSWAPNWNSPGKAEYFLSSFHAAGDLPTYNMPFLPHKRYDDILHVRGFQYAKVDQTLSTTENASIPFLVLSNLFIAVVNSPVCHYGDIKKLAFTLTGPAMAELRIARDYFSESEAVLYTGVLLDYSFVTPGLRIVDLLPYATNLYEDPQRELRYALLALRKFRPLRPSCLHWLDLEKESAAVEKIVDQTEHFGHFIQLVHKTLSSGCLASLSPIATPKITPTITLAITEGKALVKPGDEIWILFGCPTPMVLRRAKPYFLVASPAYVFDIMNGETMDGVKTPDDKFGDWPMTRKAREMKPASRMPYVSGKYNWKVEVICLR
ncbi:hypothetical protein GT037_011220 [Alternaria burnsii]|uniref:Heterokaryon incompatibility domain-containing protein n=1 Tax=Alternaria burnsii TaxID=1187904 RepID=A0A8H7AS91_9PLEO|nr:uncharacterized protein GT037_011220 [Alternaria burnsii]KAF7670641.1 hypothetical protein GT037_011220 [Alternaria burnsii]